MDEKDKTKNFEAILKVYNEKKPLALYRVEEKHSTDWPSKALKPQDVIATVSKQLRDIQKADSLKNDSVRHISNSRNPDFIPINVLYTQEGVKHHNVTKFDTQCVTDTQLIDIVDNVEAMVNVNIDTAQNLKKKFCHKEGNIKSDTTEENNRVRLCDIDDKIITKSYVNKGFTNLETNYNQEDELCIDEINTDIYKEFDTSYTEMSNENILLEDSVKIRNSNCNQKNCRSNVVDSIKNFADDLYKSNSHNDSDLLRLNVIEETKKSVKKKYNSFQYNIRRENDKTIRKNEYSDNKLSCESRNNFQQRFCTEKCDSKIDCDYDEKYKLPNSPILKTIKSTPKSKTLTPLIFPLHSFEKFESLAMPFIEENTDFEAAKHLINSQIKHNQLFISANSGKLSSVFEVNIGSGKLSENIPNKGDHIEAEESISIVNKPVTVEDEILFSSDEENDYCSEDLPKTCALKTSFYESVLDLDETIYMGFQTSSDKCIQVSKDSFAKAKNMFQSIDKEKNVNMTLTELVDIYDSKVYHFNNNLPIEQVSVKNTLTPPNENDFVKLQGEAESLRSKNKAKSDAVEENIHVIDACSVSNSIEKKEEFVGFKTASNKIIEISKESLAKTGEVFKDIDFKTSIVLLDEGVQSKIDVKDEINIVDQTILQEFESESLEEIVHDHNQMDCNVVPMLADIKKTNEKIKANDLNMNFDPGISQNNSLSHLQDTQRFLGFKTANNKDIKVSSEALKKTKDLFHDIELEDFSKCHKYPDDTFKHVTKFADINKNTNWIPSNYISKSNVYQLESQDAQSFILGFKTASNKVVKISKEVYLKSEEMFQDIDSISICKNHTPTKNDELLNDIVKFVNENKKMSTQIPFEEFKDSSNKSVNVSRKAITKNEESSKHNVLNGNNVKSAAHIPDVNNAKNINVNQYNSIIERSIYLSKNYCCDNASSLERDEKINNINFIPGFQGFKTANNKPVNISKESLLKTKKIFEDIDDVGEDKDFFFNVVEYANVKTTSRTVDKTVPTDVTSNFLGFKTASEKQVSISEDALAKTKYLFRGVDCESVTSPNKNENKITANEERFNSMNTFKGFQTASNKRVKVSDEAIARSRKIFDEIDFDVQNCKDGLKGGKGSSNEYRNKENSENKCEIEKTTQVFGFKTATNKMITISEESLKKSKQLFSDLDNGFKSMNNHVDEITSKKELEKHKNNVNFHSTIDTQLLNNFEETLHTEDFYKDTTPKQCKRSSSPILSCPKAKKRKKFETPYRNETSIPSISKAVIKTDKQSDARYKFSEKYKKMKLYSLKDLDVDVDNKFTAIIDPYILNFDFDTFLKFEFDSSRNNLTDVKWTTDNIKTCFVESVDHKIIPDGWLDNHLKLIIWKLISYEIRFPNVMRGVCSVRNVLEQLKYRYDKELHRVERPALRKLLEKDDISTRTMILVVVGVFVDGVKVQCVTNPSPNVELLVTDGWYCVKACTDRMISRLVSEGKIAVGRKIATVGAELLNCEQGMAPWENTSTVRLKLFGNSTRPARWDARLGFHPNGTILSKLSTIDPSGGKVCKTRALVTRVYPALYVEKLEDGSTVTRSERLEHLHQVKYEAERQSQLEKLYEEVEKEFVDLESSETEGADTDLRKSDQSGSQLSKLMKKSNNISQFRSNLTDSQALRLQEYSSRKKEKTVKELQKRVQDKIEAQGLHLGRNVIPLLKIRIAGFEHTESSRVSKGMVSIWRPNDAIFDVVKEGTWIDLFNVVPTAVRNSEIQMSAGRQSVFHRSKYKETDKMKPYVESLRRKSFTAKDLNKNPTMQTDFNEIDTTGMVFLVEPSLNDFETMKGQQFQNVYLTDVDKNMICINFWGGIKKFGYENIFDSGNIVACMNLQKRAGNTRKCIPQYRATELTVFTKTPKLNGLKDVTEELIKQMSGLDKRKFCDDCVVIKNNYASIKHISDFSPYRFNISDKSLIQNKMFIDSPVVQTKDLNLNLTGLDFESTFQQTDTQEVSPAILKRKQIVKEKIAKLKMYGEPPPLSKIHFVNKSKNAGSAYKSPLTSNVAGAINQDNSPITTNKSIGPNVLKCLNTTSVLRSGVNPVKLNFSATSTGDDKMETNPFEEEFEASPPLSLD